MSLARLYLAYTDIDDQAVRELVQPANDSTTLKGLYFGIIYFVDVVGCNEKIAYQDKGAYGFKEGLEVDF